MSQRLVLLAVRFKGLIGGWRDLRNTPRRLSRQPQFFGGDPQNLLDGLGVADLGGYAVDRPLAQSVLLSALEQQGILDSGRRLIGEDRQQFAIVIVIRVDFHVIQNRHDTQNLIAADHRYAQPG